MEEVFRSKMGSSILDLSDIEALEALEIEPIEIGSNVSSNNTNTNITLENKNKRLEEYKKHKHALLQTYEKLGFNILNINSKKCPINKFNKKIRNWESIDFLIHEYDPDKEISMITGRQKKSQLFIIGLDFDLYSGNGLDENVKKLFETFKELDKSTNPTMKGYFESSTLNFLEKSFIKNLF
jgi:hypothetical protein